MPSNSSPLKVPNASFTRKEDPSPAETEEQNYIVLRECLSGPIIQKLAPSSTSGVGGRTIGNAKARRKSQRNIFVNQSTTKKKTDKKTNEDSRTSSTTIRDDNKAKLENSVELQEGSRIGLDVQSANESDHGDAVEDLVEFIDVNQSFPLHFFGSAVHYYPLSSQPASSFTLFSQLLSESDLIVYVC